MYSTLQAPHMNEQCTDLKSALESQRTMNCCLQTSASSGRVHSTVGTVVVVSVVVVVVMGFDPVVVVVKTPFSQQSSTSTAESELKPEKHSFVSP